MKRIVFAVYLLLLCAVTAGSQAQVSDRRLLTDANYKAFLLQVETVLPKWETSFKNIDLEKVPQISYARGKSIADRRDLGLMEISNVHTYVAKERAKHTVSGELALYGFLESLYSIGEEIVWEESFSGLTLTSIEKDAPELSEILVRVGNDLSARVALLEKGTCP